MARKQCVACGEFKNETEFPWWSETEGRRRGTCRACKSQQQKKWYSKKRETHIEMCIRDSAQAEERDQRLERQELDADEAGLLVVAEPQRA